MPPDEETKNSRAWFKDPDADPAKPRSIQDGGLFGWTVLILLLIGLAIFCWIGSFYIFGHPEKPLSYEVLSKLKKIESPKRFELTGAPRGEFLRAPQIMERYASMRPRQLARTNEILLRNYLRNFKPCDGLVPYVLGTFNILDSFELTGNDFFPSGVVALAQSKENPNLLLEQVFCADPRMVPTLHRTLLTGLDIDLKRENELAAVINIERLSDGRIKLTTVSILYPSYESASADGTFTLDPPEKLNVRAGNLWLSKKRSPPPLPLQSRRPNLVSPLLCRLKNPSRSAPRYLLPRPRRRCRRLLSPHFRHSQWLPPQHLNPNPPPPLWQRRSPARLLHHPHLRKPSSPVAREIGKPTKPAGCRVDDSSEFPMSPPSRSEALAASAFTFKAISRSLPLAPTVRCCARRSARRMCESLSNTPRECSLPPMAAMWPATNGVHSKS